MLVFHCTELIFDNNVYLWIMMILSQGELVIVFLLLSCGDAWLWCLKSPSSDVCMTCNPWLYLTHLYLNAYLASSSDAHFLLHHMHIALPAANKFLILLPSDEPTILGWNLSLNSWSHHWILRAFVFVLLESLFSFVKICGVRSVQLLRSSLFSSNLVERFSSSTKS